MVQRKEEPQPKIKLERPRYSHQQQQKGSRSKGDGDLKKKMKLERSMRAADLEISLKEPSLKHKRPSKPPNYMKPTSSSNAKKEKAQVNLRPLMKKNSLKGVILNRATCSSTMKDSKFPHFLELNHEGNSKMRVCPYTYCSLNGHGHENLPPLKCFMASKRKLLKTQKSMKLKSLKMKKNKEGIDTGQKGNFNEAVDDFFVEIVYRSKPKEEIIEEIVEEDVVDQRSEISNEEVDGMMSLLEYVECDQQVQESLEIPGVELVIENKASTLDFGWEEEFESSSLDNMTECSDLVHAKVDEDADDKSPCNKESDDAGSKYVNREANEDGDGIANEPISMIKAVVDEGGGLSSKEVDEKVDTNLMQEENEVCDDAPPCDEISDEPTVKTPNHVNQEADEEEGQAEDEGSDEISDEQIARNKCVLDEGDGYSLNEVNQKDDKGLNQEGNEDSDDTPPCVDISNEPITPEQEEKRRLRIERIKKEEKENEVEKLRLKITKKKIIEKETDDMREFNPRSPRFLDIEPDPEAEMVDLKHQEMDGRKNSEEYLIDYALQRTVTKLGPARKKKVALLVEAFETVMPIQGLAHGGIMQACI